MHPDSSPAPGPRPCVIIRTTSLSSETPSTLAAFSSAPTTALGKLTFTSRHGPNFGTFAFIRRSSQLSGQLV